MVPKFVFLLLVFVGSFFLLNVVLAVVWEACQQLSQDDEDEQAKGAGNKALKAVKTLAETQLEAKREVDEAREAAKKAAARLAVLEKAAHQQIASKAQEAVVSEILKREPAAEAKMLPGAREPVPSKSASATKATACTCAGVGGRYTPRAGACGG